MKENDIYLHIPTGNSFRVEAVLREMIMCSVFKKGVKFASFCTRNKELFNSKDWWYYGNMNIELEYKAKQEYWTKVR